MHDGIEITQDQLYDMPLHSILVDNMTGTTILKVPGGWIYRLNANSVCFVRYDDEFDPNPMKKFGFSSEPIAQKPQGPIGDKPREF